MRRSSSPGGRGVATTDALVVTKLLRPRVGLRAVARPRLDRLLRRGSDATLTLVSAPAEFGKTPPIIPMLRSRTSWPWQ